MTLRSEKPDKLSCCYLDGEGSGRADGAAGLSKGWFWACGGMCGTPDRCQAGSLTYMDIDFRGGVQAGDRNESMSSLEL